MAKKKEKIPPPGAKGEKSTSFFTRKKWRSLMQFNTLELQGRCINPRGALVICTALIKNKSITTLDFSHNQIGDEGAIILADILRANTGLNYLNLSYNGITDLGGIALASAFIPSVSPNGQPGLWNKTLFSICLMGNDLGDDTLLAMSHAASCHRDLTRVDLSFNHIGPQGTKRMLRAFQRNPLCSFNLSANRISDEGTTYICEALKRYGGKGQTTLNLFNNDISHRGATAIGKLLENNDFLQDVNLCGNSIGLKGIQELRRYLADSANGPPTALRSLNLADNLLGDEGALEIAEIISSNLPCLERMDVSDNNFTDEGSYAIACALHKSKTLMSMNASNNIFGPKAVEQMRHVVGDTKTLKTIDLTNCIDSPDLRRSLTLAVNEADGAHVEMGEAAVMTEENDPIQRIAEHMQLILDKEAQRAAESAKKKKYSTKSGSKSESG